MPSLFLSAAHSLRKFWKRNSQFVALCKYAAHAQLVYAQLVHAHAEREGEKHKRRITFFISLHKKLQSIIFLYINRICVFVHVYIYII